MEDSPQSRVLNPLNAVDGAPGHGASEQLLHHPELTMSIWEWNQLRETHGTSQKSSGHPSVEHPALPPHTGVPTGVLDLPTQQPPL